MEDTLIRITAHNRGPDDGAAHSTAAAYVTQQLVVEESGGNREYKRPIIRRPAHSVCERNTRFWELIASNRWMETRSLPERLLFTENDSNMRRLDPNYNGPDHFSKDGFDRYVVHGEESAVKEGSGTKCALLYRLQLEPGASQTLYFRLVRIDDDPPRTKMRANTSPHPEPPVIDIARAEEIFATRKAEADDFYAQHIPQEATAEECNVSRQAFAGLLWCKQFYYFIAERWMSGDPTQIPPPPERDEESRKNGGTSSVVMFSRCLISGNIRGSLPGTRRFT